MNNKKKIKTILNSLTENEKNGFTKSIQWNSKRYIVALTNNINIKTNDLYELLEMQIELYSNRYYQINIWWWTNWNDLYIDVSTSFASLEEAKYIWNKYNQIAIWDNLDLKEIIL